MKNQTIITIRAAIPNDLYVQLERAATLDKITIQAKASQILRASMGQLPHGYNKRNNLQPTKSVLHLSRYAKQKKHRQTIREHVD